MSGEFFETDFEPCSEVSLYSLLRVISTDELGYFGILGFLIYLSGSFVNVYSEFQRYFWKLENDGLYTGGLFSLARHINYFGEVFSFVGFAMLSGYLNGSFLGRGWGTGSKINQYLHIIALREFHQVTDRFCFR